MSAVPKRKLTPAEYLAIERKAEFKSEFFNGEMFAMAGASRPHNQVKDNLIIGLGSRLKGGPCQTFSGDQRVHVERTDSFFYPDLLIVRGNMHLSSDDPDAITNPRVVIEVLSTVYHSWRYDRGAKFRNYQQIPSLTEYILVAQDEAVVERFVRQADGSWGYTSFVGLEATLALTSVPVRVPLADIYAGVEFATAPPV